jgi:capsular polysaccharide transport system permease protein
LRHAVLVQTNAMLVQLRLVASENPQIPVLNNRVQSLETEIAATSARLAGGNPSLATKVAEFQRLAFDNEFANRQLASALASLEQARNEVQRQQLYVERVAQPSLPDEAMEPRRVRAVLVAVFVLGLVAWGVLWLLVASIREHVD